MSQVRIRRSILDHLEAYLPKRLKALVKEKGLKKYVLSLEERVERTQLEYMGKGYDGVEAERLALRAWLPAAEPGREESPADWDDLPERIHSAVERLAMLAT
jgi:hypothetical protein